MNANELRIGNWVNTGWETNSKIVYVMCDSVNTTKGTRLYQDIYPIPLTDEILEKAGFEKPAHSFNGDVFHLSEWDDFPGCWCVAMNKNNAIVSLKLKYVHQLQNLYFALTGRELEIEL